MSETKPRQAVYLVTQHNSKDAVGYDRDPFLAVLRKAPKEWVLKSGRIRGITPDHFVEVLRRMGANATEEPTPRESTSVEPEAGPATAEEFLAGCGQKRTA